MGEEVQEESKDAQEKSFLYNHCFFHVLVQANPGLLFGTQLHTQILLFQVLITLTVAYVPFFSFCASSVN